MIVQYSSKSYFQSLRVMHNVNIVLVLLFTLGAYFLFQVNNLKNSPDVATLNQYLLYILPSILVLSILINFTLIKLRILQIRKKESLLHKMSLYRGVWIVRYILFLLPSLACIGAYVLVGNQLFILLTGLMMLYFLLQTPSISRAVQELVLSHEEKEQLKKPEAIIARLKRHSD